MNTLLLALRKGYLIDIVQPYVPPKLESFSYADNGNYCEYVESVVKDFYGLSQREWTRYKDNSRRYSFSEARHVIAWIIRNSTNMTLEQMSVILNRHYSTIINSCKYVDSRCDVDNKFRQKIQFLRTIL